MRAFDQLPPEVRARLAGAVTNWVPQLLLTLHRRGVLGPAALVRWIDGMDCRELDERERDRAAARGRYRGNARDSGSVPMQGRGR